MRKIDRCFSVCQKELDIACAQSFAVELRIDRITNELSQRRYCYNKLPILFKAILWPLYQFEYIVLKRRLRVEKNKLNVVHREEEKCFVHLYLRVGRMIMTSDSKLSSELYSFESDHATILKFVSSISKVKAAGADAISALEAVKKSLSSAGVVKLMDAATQNNGILALSQVSNSQVSNSVLNAKLALKKLNYALDSHHHVAADIEHSMAMEFMGLTFDIFLDGAIEQVESLFSLISISSPEKKIECVLEKLLPVYTEIEANYIESKQKQKLHEEKMLAFKNEHRLKAIPFIRERGVDVIEDVLVSLSALYAETLYD